MDLDWSTGEIPPPPGAAPPPKVRIVPGSLNAAVPSEVDRAILKNRILDALSRRVELQPSPEAFSARAAAFEETGDWGSALADLNRVIEGTPGDISALARRARAHARLRHLDEAIRDQERVVALCGEESKGLGPECSSALIALTRWRARSRAAAGPAGRPEALDLWKEVLAQAPKDLEASKEFPWLWLVRRCADSTAEGVPPLDDDANLALACAEEVLEACPEGSRNLGAILVHFGRFAEAQALLEKYLMANPASPSGILHLAIVRQHQGDRSEALRLLSKGAESMRRHFAAGSPGRQELEAILGFAERALGRPARADGPENSIPQRK